MSDGAGGWTLSRMLGRPPAGAGAPGAFSGAITVWAPSRSGRGEAAGGSVSVGAAGRPASAVVRGASVWWTSRTEGRLAGSLSSILLMRSHS